MADAEKKIYSIEVRVYATMYIRAESAEQAEAIALEQNGAYIELAEDHDAEIPISGKGFDNPDLPDVSISPMLTLHGPDDSATAQRAD